MLQICIAAGLLLGLIVGLAASATGNEILLAVSEGSAPFGAVFMNAIKMVVLPLIVTIVFTSVARLSDPRQLSKIGALTIAYYWLTLVPAIAIGMTVTKFGLQFAGKVELPAGDPMEIPELPGLIDFLISLIPANPFAAAAQGSILPLIVFTALVAAATGTLRRERRERLISLADDTSAAFIKLTWWILYIAPIGVFGLTAPVTAKLGWDLVQNLGIFIACVFVGLVIFLAVITLPVVYFASRVSPLRFLGGTFGAVSVAVSATSTVVAIPVSLEASKSRLKVSGAIADLLIPLGASMHRPGSALFQGSAIVFLAFLYDVPIPATAIATAFLATFIVSLTVAPVPSSGVVTLVPALAAVGIPVGGVGIILGIDRINDLMRTAVNLLGQISAAVFVNRWVSRAGNP